MLNPGEGRLLPADYLRRAYFKRLEDAEKLLDAFRFQWKMTEAQRQAVWVLLNDIVASRAKLHYKKAQPYGLKSYGHARPWWQAPPGWSQISQGYDAQNERVLQLVELLRSRKDKSAAWVVVTWKRQFPQFEAVRFLKSWGVSINEDGTPISYQSSFVTSVVSIDRTRRTFTREKQRPPYNDDELVDFWVELTHRKELSKKPDAKKPGYVRIRNFRKKLDQYNELLLRTRDCKSLDSLNISD